MLPLRNIKRAFKKALSEPKYALRNSYKRVANWLYYSLYNGKSYWPETISLFLTYHCNLRCKMCGQWGENGLFKTFAEDKLNQRLSVKVLSKLITEVQKFNPTITLFGGEPTLHPEIIEIIKLIKKHGLRVNMVTNGTTLEKYASEFVSLGLDEIILSIDGPGDIHNEIRGIPDLYERVKKGTQYLNKLKEENGQSIPLLNINYTIFEDNYEYIEEFLDKIGEFSPENVTLHHLLFLKDKTVKKFMRFYSGKYGSVPADWKGFARKTLPNINANKLIKELREVHKNKYDFNVGVYPNLTEKEIKRWYNNFTFKSDSYKNRCMSLWMTAYIFPDGDVKPYQSMDYTLGNIHKNRFSEIWNNKKYVNYRNYIKQNKSFPICSKGCTEFFRY